MFVVIVALEELLNRVSPQLGFAFLHSFSILPLLIVHVVLVEIVDVDVRHILRLHLPAA